MWREQSSLSGVLAAVLREVAESLRSNKIATGLAIIALVTTSVLAISSQYDERSRYRQVILPEISQAEQRFLAQIHDAEATKNETWRIYYFIAAHRKAQDMVELLKRRWPHTREARRAHADLIRYYDLLTEDFAIIRTQMSLDMTMDYLKAWRESEEQRRPLREKWEHWLAAAR